ncbi:MULTISPECIES: leucyl aminopeptidase [unclassified Campylobacter]|uniref:leucyl aminopeptidase n=1 Tax=unclassified Campylobacter TaxID=2593542 RepID=UPI0022E99B93|nr:MULTISPECIES: leucyl aminopeptidase [unclassified Campylobacter]MDA3054077.1 leucyl aminopeptidase [Campylobacter sp. VBCF_07 NA4]MDA3060036.1 leucyl aminopeptidase [Campylobacter sp. VBCF_02 NA5]MDA3069550.1 leucyl aminopeptidase [Campylobacter sp. VBCF_08 NA3]WBR53569.1 leucyl aminopeptidase [Campylobacter sp. VBCF_01 NA2]
MKVTLLNQNFDAINADFELIFIVGGDTAHRFVKDGDKFDFFDYKGEGNLLLSEQKRLYIGIKALEYDRVRVGVAQAYNTLKNLKISNFKIAFYDCGCTKKSAMAMAEGAVLGAYEFNKYKSEKKSYTLNEIFIASDTYTGSTLEADKAGRGVKFGTIMADAANFAKNGVNEIPEIYTPHKMADEAEILASNYDDVSVAVYDERFLEEEKMNAFLAVNRASAHRPRLIHLTYKPEKCLQKVVFVGKGLTYDSGGLSLKPSDYMLTMKADKSGALAAMAIIKGAAELDLPFEIHAIIGATENMIGGNAYKPDDVLISRSGVSIEVRNTDAEGRLVLADCLSYAQDLNPDLLIDMATLTGACVVGLGEYTSGLLGNNEELKLKFKNLTKPSGELFTILEFNDYLRELIKSNIADVSNTASSRYGGTTTAGLFLDKFIKPEFKDKWLHLDIAGPAYVEKAWGYNQFGATGAAVRANLYYLMALQKELEKRG